MSMQGVKEFWDQAAKRTSLTDVSAVGMLTDGNEFNATYRQKEEEKHFLHIFSPHPHMKILEVGSGGGRWSFFLADKVSSVVGIDFSAHMVNLAEKIRSKKGLSNVRFVETDLFNFDSSEKFDLVYFSGVLQYLNDDDVIKSIRKANNFLSKSGCIISRDTTQEKKRVVLNGEYPVTYRTVDEYKILFKRAGYDLNYCENSYPRRRFSTFTSKFYRLPFVSYKMAYLLQSTLISINALFGNPRFLMKKHYRDMLDEAGEREHRFFKYCRYENSNNLQ